MPSSLIQDFGCAGCSATAAPRGIRPHDGGGLSAMHVDHVTGEQLLAGIINGKGRGNTIRIEAHTDVKGAPAYNQKLSERRADAVKQWLAEKEGFGPVKMTTQSFGATKPAASNTKPDGSDDPEGRQKNRRVEIVLTK